MAVVILGGLVTSTLLTLFVVPALYLWQDVLSGRCEAPRRPWSHGDGGHCRNPVVPPVVIDVVCRWR